MSGEDERMDEPIVDDKLALVRATGEIVDLTNPTEVALALDSLDEIYRMVADGRRMLKTALGQYAEERGERTFEIPGAGTWVREGPVKTYEDPAALARELLEVGMPEDRVREIVVETIDRKVNGVEAQKAARSNERYRKVIDARTRITEKPYSVRRKS